MKPGKVELDLDTMHGSRKEAVKGLTRGIEFLFKKNKVEWLKGQASFESADTVKVGDRTVRAKNIVIATGSSVTPLPGVTIDQERIVDSQPARWNCRRCPGDMVVIGGGVIGLELGSVWRRLGAKVTVRRIPRPDPARVRRRRPQGSQQDLQEAGLRVPPLDQGHQGASARATTRHPHGRARRRRRGGNDRGRRGARFDRPRARTPKGSALDKAGLQTNQRGQIETDHEFRTKVPGIWAIGDVIPGPMLAHKAEDEGIAVAENIAGLTGIVNHDVIPSVVYTMPEIAGVGLTEEEAKEQAR